MASLEIVGLDLELEPIMGEFEPSCGCVIEGVTSEARTCLNGTRRCPVFRGQLSGW